MASGHHFPAAGSTVSFSTFCALVFSSLKWGQLLLMFVTGLVPWETLCHSCAGDASGAQEEGPSDRTVSPHRMRAAPPSLPPPVSKMAEGKSGEGLRREPQPPTLPTAENECFLLKGVRPAKLAVCPLWACWETPDVQLLLCSPGSQQPCLIWCAVITPAGELRSGQAAQARLTSRTSEEVRAVREVREAMAGGRNSSVPILESASTVSDRPSECTLGTAEEGGALVATSDLSRFAK